MSQIIEHTVENINKQTLFSIEHWFDSEIRLSMFRTWYLQQLFYFYWKKLKMTLASIACIILSELNNNYQINMTRK